MEKRGEVVAWWACPAGEKGTEPCSCRPMCLGGGPGTACSPGPCQPEPVGHRAGLFLGLAKKWASGRASRLRLYGHI